MASADSDDGPVRAPGPEAEAVADLAAGVRAGLRGAVARALNLVEDRRPEARPAVAALLRELGPGRTDGHRIGLTGPPGAGKSTLVSALAATLSKKGHAVGVVAVDPSSKRSGGALLGDRVRIDGVTQDPGLFIRSLAAAGELGGLARAAPAAVMVLAAAFERVLVETVGVGQSETDVENVVDTVVLVVVPGSGDALQFLKAGIMEIPDVIVVNKSDLGDVALRARADLLGVLGSARQSGVLAGAGPELLMVSAARKEGIDDLAAALERHRRAQVETGALEERRVRGSIEWGLRALARRVGEEGIEREGGWMAVRDRLEAQVRSGRGNL
ncbi:MAG TPA: methylmalonyl Co-A mutase-associated GTPase MeaB [Polyangiaceae bacterium]|nr:methylmalonyl Co-A mutase-associated GTPase MeaB [Polyangiaceae bacterium]